MFCYTEGCESGTLLYGRGRETEGSHTEGSHSEGKSMAARGSRQVADRADVVALRTGRDPGGVQSVERAFELLEAMADAGGVVGLSQLAALSGLPLPTIHRLMRTLVNLGYVRQEPTREYALGPRLVRLGDSSSGLIGRWAEPHLRELAEILGESANLALLDGDHITYVAQAQGRHSMRMFTEVGRRAWTHSTAVGRAMLAQLPPSRVEQILRRSELLVQTEHAITDRRAFAAELDRIREQGFAIDEGQQELGVRCVAVALPGQPTRAATSVSGPETRMSEELMRRAVPALTRTARRLAEDLHFVAVDAS
jgi:IclR family transcriptional regulator, acetate operon repressor